MENLTPQINEDQLKSNIDALIKQKAPSTIIQSYIDNYTKDIKTGAYVLKTAQKPTFKQDVQSSIQKRGEAMQGAIAGTAPESQGENALVRGIQGAAQGAGAIVDVGGDILKHLFPNAKGPDLSQFAPEGKNKQFIDDVKGGADIVSQKINEWADANPDAGKALVSILKATQGTGEIAGTIAGADVAGLGLNKIPVAGTKLETLADRIKKFSTKMPKEEAVAGKVVADTPKKLLGDLYQDVKPKSADMRDRSIAKALRLAPKEDLANFTQLTGEDLGDFMSRNNLIKDTAGETAEAIKNFQRENFDLTRDAIALDDGVYTFQDIPEMKSTIDALLKDLRGKSSNEFQNISTRLNNIKNKGEFDLLDAQYVKETFDDLESVYKRTGEIKDSLISEDKANMVRNIRRFIEERVREKNPDVDIRGLNKNVQSSRAILDAIVKRAPKADTSSVFQMGDFAVVGLGNQVLPGAGFPALFAKKVIESSPVRLRFARFMAKVAQKQALDKGVVTAGMTPEKIDKLKKVITQQLKEAMEQGDDDLVNEIRQLQDEVSQDIPTQSIENQSFKSPSVGKTEKPNFNDQGGFIKAFSEETNNLTTKILKDLEGKTTVSKQYILDATNRGELKQVERDITRQVLDTMPDGQINVKEFADKVKAELLPLNIRGEQMTQKVARAKLKELGIKFENDMSGEGYMVDKNGDFLDYDELPKSTQKIIDAYTGNAQTYGELPGNTKYESVSLPAELRGNVKNYKENIWESPIKTSAGSTHFGGATDNYFGHTRIEDMADNKTRRVIEVQSDLYQKGNLDNEYNIGFYKNMEVGNINPDVAKQIPEGDELVKLDKLVGTEGKRNLPAKTVKRWEELSEKAFKTVKESRSKEVAKLQQYNDPTAHFRMVREEIKKASQDGKTKLQFPTGETAMKIEGLGNETLWAYADDTNRRVMPDEMKVGMSIVENRPNGIGDNWIITDVLGDGKFKAVPKSNITTNTIKTLQETGKLEGEGFTRGAIEEFDISGKVDTNNPIYKFYEKEIQKYLNKYGGRKVIDDKGVSWIEIPIKKEWAKEPVDAFGKTVISPLFLGAGLSTAAVAGKAIYDKYTK